MASVFTGALRTLNSLLSAGIAITAFSLLLYSFSFNLRDRVTRSLSMIMMCVVVVFVSETLSGITQQPAQLEFWLRMQWVGILFLPPAYLHFSDALLSTTGRPSRGRRKLVVRALFVVSLGLLLLLPTNLLVGEIVQEAPAPHLQRTWLAWVFALYYALVMALSWANFVRAYNRTITAATRRRMTYLLVGALAPALGSYPYMLFGSGVAARLPSIFWLAVTVSNLLTALFLVVMAYSVAFFGVPWPDRVVKRRLFKWLLRGPLTAIGALAVAVLARRIGLYLGVDPSNMILVGMAAAILLLEHLITLAAPAWERRLFFGKDREDLDLLQTLDERLLTLGDLQQFLEAIVAAVCDRLRSSKGFAAVFGLQGLELFVMIGGEYPLEEDELPVGLLEAAVQNGEGQQVLTWDNHLLIPLFAGDGENRLLGLLGVLRANEQEIDAEQREALGILAGRAALAIQDRFRQEQAFSSLEALAPQMDMIQRLRAASRYGSAQILSAPEVALQTADLSSWVKDALTHYWGGPKLTQNPLLQLQVVQQTARENEESDANALRTILRRGIEHVRPEGERRFTAEWILYNILEMKFLEGRKVREIAMRLAMSEADLYRKQRVAIEAVAHAIVEMEQQARQGIPVAVDNEISPRTLTRENHLGR